jgi:glyceraldehyde 3-phosphate dehydrogenase
MVTRIGINGFGRIGRQVLKAMRDYYPDTLEVVAFNDLGDLKTMAHLLRYDSNYGHFDGTVEEAGDGLVIDGKHIRAFSNSDPGQIPWGDMGVEIVVEGTGVFRKADDAGKHLQGGAKKVIITAPPKGSDVPSFVVGVNMDMYDPAKHHVVSNASCTTNCLAPAVKVVHDSFHIVKGLMTTIHSYTNDQKILDLPHKDLRRARAAAMSIIPTTTGAARALAQVIPDLKGRFDGYALRVPTPTVSVVDFVATIEKEATTETLHETYRAAANGPLKGILGFSEEPLVSIDFKGEARSSVVDAEFTSVMGGDMVKVVAWYDNEWGYSVRVADLANIIAQRL